MGKKLREHLQLHKISKKKLGIFALAVISVGIIGGVTFAKYYANNSNKGVTAAANYYFSSDVLDEAVNIDDNPEEGEEVWKDVYNTTAWDGIGEYNFNFQIRNYENQLLYNSDNLDVEYKITFKLLGGDDGGTYSVIQNSGTTNFDSHKLENEVPYSIEGLKIDGGTANSSGFTVVFDVPETAGTENTEYQSPEIEVVAEITGPDFLANTKTRIGAVLHVTKVKTKYSLTGKYDFSVQSSVDNTWEDEGKAAVNAMAAFPYSITYTAGTDNAAHDIEISWDATKLQLNQFDKNYSNVVTDEDGSKSKLQVTMQPQETLELVFYRTEDFNLDELSPQQFWALIEIKDLDETEEAEEEAEETADETVETTD